MSQVPATANLDLLAGHDEAASDFGRQDVSLPYLRIVQALSPIMRRTDPKYNAEAREGLILNTITGRLTETIEVVPVKYIRRCTEWRPNRGGFVRDHGTNVEVFENLPDAGKPVRVNSAGNEVHISGMYFVLDVTGDGRSTAIMDFSGVHMKQARRWNGLLNAQEGIISGQRRRLPIFARVWRLGSVPESNDKGQWMTWSFLEGPYVTAMPDAADIVAMASALRAQAAEMALPPVVTDESDQPRPPARPLPDDDVPF